MEYKFGENIKNFSNFPDDRSDKKLKLELRKPKTKTIEIKNGNRTTYKIVPIDYTPQDDFYCKDISVNGGCMPLIDKEDYERIFGKKT